MNNRDIMGKIFLMDGVHAYNKILLHSGDIRFVKVDSLEKLREHARREGKHIALVSEKLRFFIQGS